MNQQFTALCEALECLTINPSKQNARDNLFSANHRNAMIRKYGATSAQWVTIEELERN